MAGVVLDAGPGRRVRWQCSSAGSADEKGRGLRQKSRQTMDRADRYAAGVCWRGGGRNCEEAWGSNPKAGAGRLGSAVPASGSKADLQMAPW